MEGDVVELIDFILQGGGAQVAGVPPGEVTRGAYSVHPHRLVLEALK